MCILRLQQQVHAASPDATLLLPDLQESGSTTANAEATEIGDRMKNQTTLRKTEVEAYNRVVKELMESGQAWAAIRQTMESAFPRLKEFRNWNVIYSETNSVTPEETCRAIPSPMEKRAVGSERRLSPPTAAACFLLPLITDPCLAIKDFFHVAESAVIVAISVGLACFVVGMLFHEMVTRKAV